MRTLTAIVLTVIGAWLLLRRRKDEEHAVVVAWGDGSELQLEPRSPGAERLAAVAREALR